MEVRRLPNFLTGFDATLYFVGRQASFDFVSKPREIG